MTQRAKAARHRVGRISIFEHHGGWWIYHRLNGKPVRRLIGDSLALAECEASLLNAKSVADAAGIAIDSIPAMQMLGLTKSACAQTGDAEETSISIQQLRQAFLAHHENVLRSSLATISRYRAATLYIETFLASQKICDLHQLSVSSFTEFLRTTEISPNGHANTAKRRLRDKGVRFILECTRTLYHFGHRSGLLPKHRPTPFADSRIGGLRIRDAKPVFVFSAEQERAFFIAASWHAFAIHFTCVKTGARPGELSHALIEDVDLDQGWLHVRSKPELGWTTKTNRERRVPLIGEVEQVMREVIGPRSCVEADLFHL